MNLGGSRCRWVIDVRRKKKNEVFFVAAIYFNDDLNDLTMFIAASDSSWIHIYASPAIFCKYPFRLFFTLLESPLSSLLGLSNVQYVMDSLAFVLEWLILDG